MKTIVYLILALFAAVAFITFTPVDSPQVPSYFLDEPIVAATADSEAMTASSAATQILAYLIATLTVLAAVSLGMGRLLISSAKRVTANFVGKYEVGWQGAKTL